MPRGTKAAGDARNFDAPLPTHRGSGLQPELARRGAATGTDRETFAEKHLGIGSFISCPLFGCQGLGVMPCRAKKSVRHDALSRCQGPRVVARSERRNEPRGEPSSVATSAKTKRPRGVHRRPLEKLELNELPGTTALATWIFAAKQAHAANWGAPVCRGDDGVVIAHGVSRRRLLY